MSSLNLSEGTIFAGRYQILRRIAQGGMGAVYEVLHIETDRRRALKVLLPSLLQSNEMRAHFRQEARITARVASEYIVDVFDAGIDEATQMPFLVMELLEGEELEHLLKQSGPCKPHDVITYLHQASFALDKTHRASIVHRDLKPANLFLTEREDGSPRIKVLDFGIAKLVAEGATGPTTQLLGTPVYMAPEQFQVGFRLGPPVDIFALGMIAFTLLTGKPYWHDEMAIAGSPQALYIAIMQGPREPACARAARRGVILPPAFDAWFARATAFAPHQRFHTASSAIVALREVFGVSVARRSSTLAEVDFKPPWAAPPLSLDSVAPTTPQRAPAKGIGTPIAALPALGSASAAATALLRPSRAERSADASPPSSIGAAALSTTLVGSQTMTARRKPRSLGTAVAIAMATLSVVGLVTGTVLLRRGVGAGEPRSRLHATSEESAAPTQTVTAAPGSEQAPSPSASAHQAAPDHTAQASLSTEPSSTPAARTKQAAATKGSIGSRAPQEALTSKPKDRPLPTKKPATTARPPPSEGGPAIQFD